MRSAFVNGGAGGVGCSDGGGDGCGSDAGGGGGSFDSGTSPILLAGAQSANGYVMIADASLVPEPAPAALLGAGLAGIGLIGRRARRRIV